ncbi:glycosyltransferase [Taibaiella sp. KBW10]|uniref:glycosyltransferase n=1 Tax=Taibaiella sp. KBW10 TaxID=2153357 RepID=UPI0013158C64|nr:glycosyltransferase [Taibaiella sp. KBW10]
MISIIISSYKPKLFAACISSIEQTIGVPYEMIQIENPGLMSIAEAYNKGIAQAKNEILCFVHEDVVFHTPDWGKRLEQALADKTIGLLGVAGSKLMGNAPGAWWDFGAVNYVQNIIQHKKGQIQHNRTFSEGNGSTIVEVAVIDGVFMASRKSVQVMFNTDVPGFHAYDLSYSMELQKRNLKVVVADGILLEHFSSGNIDPGWFYAMDHFYTNYCNSLPVAVQADPQQSRYEEEAIKYYILNAPTKKLQRKYWRIFFRRKPFAKFNIAFLKTYILG